MHQQYWKQYHATEEKSGYCRTCPREDLTFICAHADVTSDHNEGIPLAYNKDMQEDKELSFDAIDTTKGCIVSLFTGMLDNHEFYRML